MAPKRPDPEAPHSADLFRSVTVRLDIPPFVVFGCLVLALVLSWALK